MVLDVLNIFIVIRGLMYVLLVWCVLNSSLCSARVTECFACFPGFGGFHGADGLIVLIVSLVFLAYLLLFLASTVLNSLIVWIGLLLDLQVFQG